MASPGVVATELLPPDALLRGVLGRSTTLRASRQAVLDACVAAIAEHRGDALGTGVVRDVPLECAVLYAMTGRDDAAAEVARCIEAVLRAPGRQSVAAPAMTFLDRAVPAHAAIIGAAARWIDGVDDVVVPSRHERGAFAAALEHGATVVPALAGDLLPWISSIGVLPSSSPYLSVTHTGVARTIFVNEILFQVPRELFRHLFHEATHLKLHAIQMRTALLTPEAGASTSIRPPWHGGEAWSVERSMAAVHYYAHELLLDEAEADADGYSDESCERYARTLTRVRFLITELSTSTCGLTESGREMVRWLSRFVPFDEPVDARTRVEAERVALNAPAVGAPVGLRGLSGGAALTAEPTRSVQLHQSCVIVAEAFPLHCQRIAHGAITFDSIDYGQLIEAD